MPLQADWLLKQVKLKLPLATWQAELQATPSAGLSRAEMDQFTSSQFKLDLKERATTNEIKREQREQRGEGAAELLP